jgi:hypothetical protein
MVISKSNHVNPKNRQRAPFFDQDTSLPPLKAPSCLPRLSFTSSTLDRLAIATKRLKIHKMSKLTLYMDLEQKLPLMVFERPPNFIVVANFKEK